MLRKPWLEGPVAVLELGIEQYYMSIFSRNMSDSNRYRRIAVITTDDAVELAAKAFLQHDVVQEKTRTSFGKILRQVKEYSGAFTGELLRKLEYYHDTRNLLYHEGALYSIPRSHLLDFIGTSIRFLKAVYGNDAEQAFRTNPRGLLLFAYIQFERIAFSLALDNRIPFNEETDPRDLVRTLADRAVINNEIRHAFNRSGILLKMVMPQAEGFTEIDEAYDSIYALADSIMQLEELQASIVIQSTKD